MGSKGSPCARDDAVTRAKKQEQTVSVERCVRRRRKVSGDRLRSQKKKKLKRVKRDLNPLAPERPAGGCVPVICTSSSHRSRHYVRAIYREMHFGFYHLGLVAGARPRGERTPRRRAQRGSEWFSRRGHLVCRRRSSARRTDPATACSSSKFGVVSRRSQFADESPPATPAGAAAAVRGPEIAAAEEADTPRPARDALLHRLRALMAALHPVCKALNLKAAGVVSVVVAHLVVERAVPRKFGPLVVDGGVKAPARSGGRRSGRR